MIDKASLEQELLAGSSASNADGSKKLMVDLLHERFDADDLVKIHNFTSRNTGWVYSDRRGLRIEQPNEFTRRVYQGEQKVRVLGPGETVVIPGWEAYVALVRFFKQYCSEEFSDALGVHMNSPKDQNEFIDKAFIGIYDPNEVEEPKSVKEEVESDLGLVEKTEETGKWNPNTNKEEEPEEKPAKKDNDLGLVNAKAKSK